ncbi:DNRLRE domain-containing protein [Paenibacillus sp. HWE-109]|uniref:CBM96 family carbohydrate-binding protein n=1 Tax=Paenibacillus sp. HWE-109 TaxID=1306526 RepID=UPI001EDEB3D5|nr:DNRLRE domain-containing protein [Paenibacillus sp. HWE-109]UKS29775.1 DNRLRE domain-containing protein [Paenibacillus sp. HWE-109]
MNRSLSSKISFLLCMVLMFASWISAYPNPVSADVGGGAATPVTVRVYASDDAFVRGGANANTKFGATTPASLQVKNYAGTNGVDKREAFIKFDLSSIPGVITGASLNIYGAVTDGAQPSGKPVSLSVYGVASDSWSGAEITWNASPLKDQVIAAPITMLNNKPANWYSADVSSYAAGQQVTDMTASMALTDLSLANCLVILNSSEAVNKPYLRVTFLPANPGDTQPPIWLGTDQLSVSLDSSDKVHLEWPQAEDDSGIASYRIYANDRLIGSVPSAVTHFTTDNLIPGTMYHFRVEAADFAWNWTHNGLLKDIAIPLSEISLIPSDDTFVNGGAKVDMNYGSETTLLVKKNSVDLTRESLLKFDHSSAIAAVGTATLYLFAYSSDGGGAIVTNQLYSTNTEQWNEAAVTWNNKPAAQHYLQSFTVNRTPGWYAMDVTSYVKEQFAANKSASFLIRQEVQNGLNVILNSKENAVNKPYLKITSTRVPPGAPVWGTSPEIAVTHAGEDEISVSWAQVSGADAYRIYANGVLAGTVSGSAINYTLTNLEIGKSYTIKLEAGKNGVWSTDGPLATASTVETKFVQSQQLGNVFLSSETPNVKVQTGRSAISWQMTDVWGTVAATGTAEPNNGEAIITFPASLRGYFSLKVTAEKVGRAPIDLETSLTVLAPYDGSQVSSSPFGVNTHLARTTTGWSPDLTELIDKAGIKNVRDASEWGSVEKQLGVYSIPSSPAAAAYMNDFRNKSIDQLWVLAFTNPLYDANSTPYTAEGREGFANHAKAVLDAYNGANASAPGYTRFLKEVEVYNEYNIGFGDRGTGPADSKPEYYYPMLKKTYETVKAAHPQTTVVGMSTAGVPLSWLESVMKLGGLSYMDAVSIHPYVYPKDPEQMLKSIDDMNVLIRKYNGGQTKPLWFTELGWPTHNTLSGVSEKKSADDLVRAYVLSLAKGVEKIYWYDFMNDGTNPAVNEDNFGLVRNKNDKLGAYTPKPAYTAYAVLIRQLSGAIFTADESMSGSYFTYLFKKEGQDTRVLWSVQPTPVAIRTQTPVRVVDYMGNETIYTPVQGKVYLTLNSDPVYLSGAIDGMDEDRTFYLNGETSLVREAGKLKLTVDNKTSETLTGMFEMNGQSYAFQAAVGSQQVLDLQVPGMDHEGSLPVRGKLISSAGNPLGHLSADIPFHKPFTIEVKPAAAVTSEEDPAVHIVIGNHAAEHALHLSGINWSIGGLSGTIPPKVIAPTTMDEVTIALPGFEEGKSYPLDITVRLDGYDPIRTVSSIDFNKVAYRGDVTEPVLIDLSTGTNKIKAESYTGKEDLSGNFHLSWDETNFYLDADVVDDVFQYPFTGQELYKNDSIQFGIAAGIPGLVSFNYEIGLSMTPEGSKIYFYNAPQGIPLGIHDNGDMILKVTRDEATHVTSYRLAMPWRELEPTAAVAGNTISFSLLVNENDNGSRDGYIEWGSGIGSAKDATLFRSAQLMAPAASDHTPPTAVVAYSTTASTNAPVIATITPSEPVTITNNGGSNQYTFLANGSFTFEFVDSAGNSGTATATVGNIASDSTGAPGKPVISDDNGYDTGIKDGSYKVTMNLWWGNNGMIYKLYENDVLIDTQMLGDHTPNVQSAVTDVTNKPNGTYRYVAELTNALGTTRSDPLTVQVNGAAPAKPELSSDNWAGADAYTIAMNMWWGTNGTRYRLYENGVLIDTLTLNANSPKAQSTMTVFRDKPRGTYEYWCELANDAGVSSSEKLIVQVN